MEPLIKFQLLAMQITAEDKERFVKEFVQQNFTMDEMIDMFGCFFGIQYTLSNHTYCSLFLEMIESTKKYLDKNKAKTIREVFLVNESKPRHLNICDVISKVTLNMQKMEPVFKFNFLTKQLFVEDKQNFVKESIEYFSVEEIITMIFCYFANQWYSSDLIHDSRLLAINELMSKHLCIKQADCQSEINLDSETGCKLNYTLHSLSTDGIQYISRYLSLKEYMRFCLCCRNVYVMLNSPSQITNLEKILRCPKTSGYFPWSQLYRFPKLTHLTADHPQRLIQCYQNHPDTQWSKLQFFSLCNFSEEQTSVKYICDNALLPCPELRVFELSSFGRMKFSTFSKLLKKYCCTITNLRIVNVRIDDDVPTNVDLCFPQLNRACFVARSWCENIIVSLLCTIRVQLTHLCWLEVNDSFCIEHFEFPNVIHFKMLVNSDHFIPICRKVQSLILGFERRLNRSVYVVFFFCCFFVCLFLL